MFQSDDTESPPLIFGEVNKLVDRLESSDDKIYQLKHLLVQKQTYLEQLDQHNNDELNSIAKKRAELTILNRRVNMIDTQNIKFRDGALKSRDSCQEVCQNINDLESKFVECEEKFEKCDNKLNNDTNQYEKKIDDLIRLLDQLTEKRNKKLALLKSQENRYLQEILELKKEDAAYEIQEESTMDDNTDYELDVLENEVQELQRKLSILDTDYCKLNSEEKDCETAEAEVAEKYSELTKLERRFAQVNNEVIEQAKNLETEKCTESELTKSALTLEEYEAKLDEEIMKTSRFWNDLAQNPYEGFSKVEQEIAIIKGDIMERNEKYKDVQNSYVNCMEKVQKKSNEIESTHSKVELLSSELKEMESVLDNLETSAHYSEKHDKMMREIEELHKEKEQGNSFAAIMENEIKETATQLRQEMEKGNLELVVLENDNLMEHRKLEKYCTATEDAEATVEQKAQSAANDVKELKKKYHDISSNMEQTKEVDIARKEAEASMKLIKIKISELRAQLGTAMAPSPIYVKPNDKNIVQPRTKEIFSKKNPHMQSPAVSKRHWDSDSSMGTDECALEDLLNRRHKKRPDAENPKKTLN